MSAEVYVWKVTTPSGDSCHFGGEVDALAYARSTGTVERIRLLPRDFTVVHTDTGSTREPPRSPAQPDAAIAIMERTKYLLNQEIEWVTRTAQYHESPWVEQAQLLLARIDAFLRGGSGG